MSPPFIRTWLFLLLCFVLTPCAAHADGVYFPKQAFPALPTIPQQQAVIIYRQGTETLIVESAFQTQSPDVAWVLPLPAEPTELKLAEPGAVTSATFGLAPKITHDLHSLFPLSLILCLALIPVALVAIFTRDPANRIANIKAVVMGEVLVLLLAAVLLPSLGTAGGAVASTPGISVISAQRLGDAEFTVLRATTADALDDWLKSQYLRDLDPPARAIVSGYIKDNWCFVVGQLRNPSEHLAIPRPLMATFPSAKPIFPMKITALANTTTHVDLCIIADQQASAPGIHCAAADRFNLKRAEEEWPFPSASSHYSSADQNMAIGHPDLVPLMWPDCVVTRLTADLAPADMSHDVMLSLAPLVPHRDTFYTYLSRQQITAAALMCGVAVCLITVSIVWRGRRKASTLESRILRGTLAAALVVPLGIYLVLPTVPVVSPAGGSRFAAYRQQRDLTTAASMLAVEGHIRRGMTPEETAALPQLMIDTGLLHPSERDNPFTGQPIRPECSPGNFALRTEFNKTYFCTYDRLGIEYRSQILPAPPHR